MENIKLSLNKLLIALKDGKPVVCNQNGEWRVEGSVLSWMRDIGRREEARFLTIAKALEKLLIDVESIPVRYNAPQMFEFTALMAVVEEVLHQLENKTSSSLQRHREQLRFGFIALKYRLEASNGGWDAAEVQKNVLAELLKCAEEWKKQQAVLSESFLSSEDKNRLQETVRFKAFAESILKNEEMRQRFFEWILRDKIAPLPFIEFPAMSHKIIDCALNGRIGRFGGSALKVSKFQNQKNLTLPIEGKPVSLLDEKKEIVFKGNYRLTLRDIFEIFKNKKYRVGNLEFMADGIINWNVHHLGWWNAHLNQYHRIDMDKPLWWTQLPTFEVLTQEQAQRRYQMPLNGKNWNIAARASRGTPTLDFDQTHAFIEAVIPRGDGSYGVYDFGKFAFVFPSSFFENFLTFCHTVHATVAYPDENVFYTHRQHGLHSFLMTDEEGIAFMDLIKEDIKKSRNRNFVFQIESENCAKWTHEKLIHVLGIERVPNLFKMPLLKTEPVGFCRMLFDWVKKLPTTFQIPVLTRLHLLIGAAKSTSVIENGEWVIRSLSTHEFWRTGEVYLPAFLIHQKQAGAIVAEVNEY